MPQLWLILLAWLPSVWLPSLGLNQTQGTVTPMAIPPVTPQVDYEFGEQITITVQLEATESIQTVHIDFLKDGPISLPGGDLTLTGQTGAILLDLKKTPLRAFSTVTYHFNILYKNGQTEQSPDFSFIYEDDRFDWQHAEEGPFHVHWYDPSPETGLMVLNLAQAALDNAQQWYAAPAPERVEIYVYSNALEMQSTLMMGNLQWVAGHADPELGLIVVTLPPGPEQRMLAEQRIPHELTHILLYQRMQKGYANLPAWLSEGLASVAETQPNPDYDTILKAANEKDVFIPFDRLCQSFPTDINNAFLAYAQSEWFTRYLYKNYGAAKMQDLLDQYTQGADCTAAPGATLGISLTDLQDQWLSDQFGRNILLKGVGEALPWLVLLAAALCLPLGSLILRPRRITPGEPPPAAAARRPTG